MRDVADIEIEIAPNRRQRSVQATTAEDFWKRIQKPDGCWLYDGCKEINGYGYLMNPFGEKPRYMTAHRVAWTFANGQIPEGMRVLHRCDIRACINPEHLFLGTDAENQKDKKKKDRHIRGEKSWSAKLTDDQVRAIRRDFKKTSYRQSNTAQMAIHYGVSIATISGILRGATWKHLK